MKRIKEMDDQWDWEIDYAWMRMAVMLLWMEECDKVAYLCSLLPTCSYSSNRLSAPGLAPVSPISPGSLWRGNIPFCFEALGQEMRGSIFWDHRRWSSWWPRDGHVMVMATWWWRPWEQTFEFWVHPASTKPWLPGTEAQGLLAYPGLAEGGSPLLASSTRCLETLSFQPRSPTALLSASLRAKIYSALDFTPLLGSSLNGCLLIL